MLGGAGNTKLGREGTSLLWATPGFDRDGVILYSSALPTSHSTPLLSLHLQKCLQCCQAFSPTPQSCSQESLSPDTGAKGIQKATGKVPNDRASSPEQDKDMQQERSSETAVWLHGTMSIEVLGAVGLPRHRVLLSCRQQVMA